MREIVRQVCAEQGVQIISGVLSSDHVHMLISIPPKRSVSAVVQRRKGRSSHRVQRDFPAIGKRYWGRYFWARWIFSTTAGNITEGVIRNYLEEHDVETTGASR